MKKTIKEIGLPVLVVLVPVILAIVNNISDFGIMQWLLSLFWLLLIVGGVVLFYRVFQKDDVLDKGCIFVATESLSGIVISLLLHVFWVAFICFVLMIAACVLDGFYDIYRNKTRYKGMDFCFYSALLCCLIASVLEMAGMWEWLCEFAFVLQFVLFSCWLIAAMYNGAEWLIKQIR